MLQRCSIPVVLLFVAGQSVGAQGLNRFEVASVQASPDTPVPYMRAGLTLRGTYEIDFATMADLIATAYGFDVAKVAGGPSWLDWDRFDVIAKVPAGATLDTVRPMLRSLLADRFKLVAHTDTKPTPAFILTAGARPLMKASSSASDAAEETGCKLDGPGAGLVAGPGAVPAFAYTCHSLTMGAFAAEMPRMPGVLASTNNLPVVDRTGLTGTWDFKLRYTLPGGETRYGAVPSASDLITLPAALSKQLGLELKPGSTLSPVIVVDRVNETPVPDPPGTVQALPKPPDEFDVSDLKPTDPASHAFKFQLQNGSVAIQGAPLADLIYRAWNVSDPDAIAGMPGWAETARFDIIAKLLGPGPDPLPHPGVKASHDGTIVMLRRLLTDRFEIKTHYEDRPLNAYTLLLDKSKMKKADPASRTNCKPEPGLDGKDPRLANPAVTRLLNCVNVTMAQFGKLLLVYADDYVHSPVADGTGLEGGWNFTLHFSDAAVVDANAQSTDPNNGISLADAVDKQLGLKLRLQKRPVRVLVIDHLNQKPVEN